VPGDHLFELLVSKQSPDGLPTELGHKQDDLESSRLDALKACFEKLSTHHQECLNHRYKEGMSLKTIAQKLNKSENSISQLLVRIKAFLAECISKNINKTN
jgi:RNA polymerase sigma factor (sigma-70 family)